MAQEIIGHRCKVCGGAFKTRKKAKDHVNSLHDEVVTPKHGPGRHVDYINWDLSKCTRS